MQKSHKNPAAASAEHAQSRTHSPIGSTYGLEKGAHPNRQVGPERWSDLQEDDLERRHDARWANDAFGRPSN